MQLIKRHLERKKITEHWMISEKALRNLNITGKISLSLNTRRNELISGEVWSDRLDFWFQLLIANIWKKYALNFIELDLYNKVNNYFYLVENWNLCNIGKLQDGGKILTGSTLQLTGKILEFFFDHSQCWDYGPGTVQAGGLWAQKPDPWDTSKTVGRGIGNVRLKIFHL